MVDQDLITGRTSNVRELFTGRRYTIEAYQREYSWETKHVEDLISDLGQRFLSQWQPLHERRDVQHYQSYFLGPIVTTADERINLIDGQQRLTTLTLLLIFLRRLQVGRDDSVADIGPLIYSQLYGEEAFSLDIADRRRGMAAILRGYELDPKKASPSERVMAARYRDIEETFPENLRGEALPFFIDWLLGRVVVMEIITRDAATGQEIFETMNDRGQRLTSLDMLKSYLVGRAGGSGEEVRRFWRSGLAPLADLDPDGPADLLKYWLRARYARDLTDDDAIDTAMHQWVRRHGRLLGLNRASDHRDFILHEINFAAGHYHRLLWASRQLTPGLEPVFYNAYNKLTLQFPLILATLRPGDSDEEFLAKAGMVAGFLDIFAARCMVGYQDFRQALVWRRMLELTRELRRLDRASAGALLAAELDALTPGFLSADAFGLRQRNRAHVKYLLARLSAYVDRQCGVDHDFAWYAANGCQAYEIEHVLPNRTVDRQAGGAGGTGGTCGAGGKGSGAAKAASELRNRFGALVLLPRAANAGFGSLPYQRKLLLYAGQNLLARSLHPVCYQRNPAFARFVAASGLPFQPYPDGFDERAIRERQQLYLRLAAAIWDPATVGLPDVAGDGPRPGPVVAPRQRGRTTVSLAMLLRSGELRPGRLIGEHLGVEYRAELTERGTLRLDTGAEFSSPSAAAMTALDRPSWNGWTFWCVPHADGSRTRLDVIRRAAIARGLPDADALTRAPTERLATALREASAG